MRRLSLWITVILLVSACQEESAETSTGKKAREIWRHNERIIERVVDGDAELDEEFMGAWRFFRDTVGIVVRMDGDYFGLRLISESEADLASIQDWYRSNSQRLFWDESAKVVVVKAPPGPAGEIWWRHESVLLDLIAGETVPEQQKTEARRFFLDLTGIDVFASRGKRNALVPLRGPQALSRLRDWYEENGAELTVDPSSGKIERSQE